MATPQSAGLASVLPNLALNVNQALNAALLDKPNIIGEYYQTNPDADKQMERLFASLAAFTKTPVATMEWQNTFVDNQFQNLHVLAHGAGAPGATVNITLNPASFVGTNNALAFESYEYIGYSSITGNSFTGFVDTGGITYTSGAWVLAMEPTDEVAGVIPAQAAGDPLRLLMPVTREGNTSHLASGRVTNIYSETKTLQMSQNQGIQITDLAAFAENTWTMGKYNIEGSGSGTSQLWSLREIDLGMQQWHQSDMWGRLHNSGEMVVTDTRGRYSSEGLWHWIENNGGNLFTFTGTVSTVDIENWIIQLRQNYESQSNYLILGGFAVTTAIRTWIAGGHINGQHIVLEKSTMNLDFEMFTYLGITFHIPMKPFTEWDNQFGHGEFNYTTKAIFIPIGKTSIENSVGGSVPMIEWKYLSNNNPIFDGVEGADHLWWELGPSFISRPVAAGSVVVTTNNDTATVYRKRTEGNNFKKPQLFAILQQ